MSHHLDSPPAHRDPRLDITNLYVFRGKEGTVFVLNVNPSRAPATAIAAQAPQGFHPEAQYAIKLDLDGDAVEDLTYCFTFVDGVAEDVQTVALRRLSGRAAQDSAAPGTEVAKGTTAATIAGMSGLRMWAGRAADPCFIDHTLLTAVGSAFKDGNRIDLSGWQPSAATDRIANATVSAIVLEVPDAELLWRLREVPSSEALDGDFTWRLRPEKRINIWGTTMLATEAGGWQPISRAGHPMIQPIFHADDDVEASHYSTTAPADDLANYGERFARAVAAVVAAQGTSVNPQAYGEAVAAILLPDVLPYELGTPAIYGFARHNGRALTDNASDVMFSLVTNSPITGGLSSEGATDAVRDTFPYVIPIPWPH